MACRWIRQGRIIAVVRGAVAFLGHPAWGSNSCLIQLRAISLVAGAERCRRRVWPRRHDEAVRGRGSLPALYGRVHFHRLSLLFTALSRPCRCLSLAPLLTPPCSPVLLAPLTLPAPPPSLPFRGPFAALPPPFRGPFTALSLPFAVFP